MVLKSTNVLTESKGVQNAPTHPVHYLHELPHSDEERLEKIFNQLDRDGNGRIDIHDLSAEIKKFGLSHQYAEKFLQQSDMTKSGDVGLAEFIHYVREHEKNLRLQFSHLDKNKDGKVDLEELISAFKDLGIDMDKKEATNLLARMDQDGSLNISFDEWRDFLLLAPSTDIHGLIKFWRHSTPIHKDDAFLEYNYPDTNRNYFDWGLGKLLTKLTSLLETTPINYFKLKHLPSVTLSNFKKFLQQSDMTKSGDVGLAEFIHYVREHEKNLRLQFSHLDKNKDGKVDLEELISAFKDLGIDMDKKEATNLLARMDQDGSLNISFDEWRDFLLLAPSTDIHGLIKFWRHSTPIHKDDAFLEYNYPDTNRNYFDWGLGKLLTKLTSLLETTPINYFKLKHLPSVTLSNFKYLDIGEDLNVPDDFTQSEMQTGMWWRHLAAGGVAGAVSRTCTAPLDRLKVFLQVNKSKQRISECLKYMLKEGGVQSLWRGNGINVLKIAPESAIKFAAYEQVKRLIRGNEKRNMLIYERFIAGACAGGVSQTAIYPLEVLKTRLALRKTGQYSGILDAAYKIYLSEGIRSFYRGYIPNMLGIIPYAGIDLAVYETLKKTYLEHHQTEQPSFLLLLACGSASSTLGQVCSYPLALVRTRLQAQVITAATQIRKPEYTMVGTFKNIVRTEGITGLYRGITPNFIKVLPAVSISYIVYEYSSRALGVNMT